MLSILQSSFLGPAAQTPMSSLMVHCTDIKLPSNAWISRTQLDRGQLVVHGYDIILLDTMYSCIAMVDMLTAY